MRDQIVPKLVPVFCCAAGFAPLAEANTILNILTQPQRLDAALVAEFEASRKVAVRVEFVSSALDYESRIKSLPHSWDLVLADEQRLVSLSLAKLLKTLPESVMIPPNLSGLERRARANEDGRSYLNLMADPMGLMYLEKSKTGTGPVSWNWIAQPNLNPLWRSRVALFADERLNLMIASLATGTPISMERSEEHAKVAAWMTQAQLQGRSVPLNSSVTAFLAEKYTVATVWQSDFLHASRYVKDLVFTVPVDGTYVERVGVGLVAESRNEPVAIEFIKFIHERRDQLAKNRALLPLHAKDVDGSQTKDWRIFSDDVPLMKDYATHVQRIKREKESRAARSR